MREELVAFESAGFRLAGTAALPEGQAPFPCVLFITGSGKVDRDENHKKLKMDAFRQISARLAENGIASLRYDKRGVGESRGDYWSTGFHDNTADALCGLGFLKTRNDIRHDKVFLLGHSEGAIQSARIAGKGAEIAGAVLVAGTARSGEEVMKWQGEQVFRTLKGFNAWLIKLLRIDPAKAQQKNLDKLKKTTRDTVRMQRVAKINAKWMREFLAYDPSEDLARISVPVLAVTGGKDLQTPPADLERMAELVKAPFESHVIPDMSHIMRTDPGEPSLSHYREQVKRPVDSRLMDIVTDWLIRQIAVAG